MCLPPRISYSTIAIKTITHHDSERKWSITRRLICRDPKHAARKASWRKASWEKPDEEKLDAQIRPKALFRLRRRSQRRVKIHHLQAQVTRVVKIGKATVTETRWKRSRLTWLKGLQKWRETVPNRCWSRNDTTNRSRIRRLHHPFPRSALLPPPRSQNSRGRSTFRRSSNRGGQGTTGQNQVNVKGIRGAWSWVDSRLSKVGWERSGN